MPVQGVSLKLPATVSYPTFSVKKDSFLNAEKNVAYIQFLVSLEPISFSRYYIYSIMNLQKFLEYKAENGMFTKQVYFFDKNLWVVCTRLNFMPLKLDLVTVKIM